MGVFKWLCGFSCYANDRRPYLFCTPYLQVKDIQEVIAASTSKRKTFPQRDFWYPLH